MAKKNSAENVKEFFRNIRMIDKVLFTPKYNGNAPPSIIPQKVITLKCIIFESFEQKHQN